MNENRQLIATGLRVILATLLFVIPAVGIAGSFYSYSWLRDAALATSHAAADATASQDTLANLQRTEKELEAKSATVDKARNIVAESKSYQYQDQIISDLNTYAQKSGLSITNIDFAANQVSATAPKPATPTAVAPAGTKSMTATVSLKTPVNYTNFLNFVHSIEKNLTKMQVSRINLSRSESSKEVTSEALTIQVYVR